jgi:hypothetical protein
MTKTSLISAASAVVVLAVAVMINKSRVKNGKTSLFA